MPDGSSTAHLYRPKLITVLSLRHSSLEPSRDRDRPEFLRGIRVDGSRRGLIGLRSSLIAGFGLTDSATVERLPRMCVVRMHGAEIGHGLLAFAKPEKGYAAVHQSRLKFRVQFDGFVVVVERVAQIR